MAVLVPDGTPQFLDRERHTVILAAAGGVVLEHLDPVGVRDDEPVALSSFAGDAIPAHFSIRIGGRLLDHGRVPLDLQVDGSGHCGQAKE